MRPKDVQAYEAEDKSAGELHPLAQIPADPSARQDAAEAEHGGDEARGDGQHEDGGVHGGKADPHRQSIDGRGKGNGEQRNSAGGVRGRTGRILRTEGLPDHVASDDEEQRKGHPVVVARYEAEKRGAEQPPRKRHDELESAARNGDAASRPTGHGSETRADAQGRSEGIHGEGCGGEEHLDQGHGTPPAQPPSSRFRELPAPPYCTTEDARRR